MKCLYAITLMAIISTSCGTGAETGSSDILSVMPGGHDYYLIFDPDAIGLQRILEEAAGFIQPGQHQQVIENLGFDPLDWQEWETRLSLQTGSDVGVVIDRGVHDVSLMAFYLPGADAAATESFFNELMLEPGNFRGVLDYIETDGYVIVLMAESEEVLAGFDPEAPSLGESDQLFDELSQSNYAPDATLYIRTFDEDEKVLQSLLVEVKIDQDILGIRFCAAIGNQELNRIVSVFSGSQDSEFRVPEVSTGVLTISLDIDKLLEIIQSEVAPGELDNGIQAMGFTSFADFIDSFNGDICISFCEEPPYNASVQLGLEDPDAISAFLGLLTEEDPGITTLEYEGTDYYRMTSPGIPGVDSIEYGIFGNVLYFCSGCDIEDALEGVPLKEYLVEYDLGVGSDHSIVLSSSLAILMQAAEARIFPMTGETLPAFERVSGYADMGDGIISVGLALKTMGGSPMDLLMDYLEVLSEEM